jgi:predicted anti-sigma-YlaC factor YlaD
MLSCQEVCDKAQDYSDGKGSALMRLRIRLHLALCRNCTGFIDQTRQTSRLIETEAGKSAGKMVSSELMAEFRKSRK